MKKKFVRDISASSLQFAINQLTGIFIFYITSRFLDKNSFGELNWSVAVLVTIFNILGGGIDQIVVRKIASKIDTDFLLKIYLVHVLINGTIFYGGLLFCSWFFPGFFSIHYLLVYLAVSQLFTFFSLPFKQVATGEEQFRILFYMSTCSNLVKTIGLLVLMQFPPLNMMKVSYLYILSSAVELIVCLIFSKTLESKSLTGKWNRLYYKDLIKESLPQLGSVIFNSAVARFDWIVLGLLASSQVIAEYSFAYKVFELSTLPLLILAPLLLPRFTRFFNAPSQERNDKTQELFVLLRIEMICAALIILILNILWVPVIDAVTNHKYGAVNSVNIFLLSACLPFLFLNNFIWTIHFAQGRLTFIFRVISITFIINVVGDLILIPFFSGLGAAIAYFSAIIIQTIIYMKNTKITTMSVEKAWYPLISCSVIAVVCGFSSKWIFSNIWLQFFSCIALFLALIIATGQFRRNDWLIFKKAIGIGI
jgi:O-antigen/teichoic acid export membrane protein